MLKVVISGVNLVEGGILSILQDSLKSIAKIQKSEELDVTVLLHDKNLVDEDIDKSCFSFIEYPSIKSSWLKRVKFEYIESKQISNLLKPDLWISLHDITPNVNCKFQVVYCHNPSVFYKLDTKRFFYDIKFSLFCIFYKYLYQINIKKNAYVIVQQNWIREAFRKMYNVATIVAYPMHAIKLTEPTTTLHDNLFDIDFRKKIFFFPSIPRTFKNFEVVCKAAELLEKKNAQFELVVTLNGTENTYASEIIKKYGHVKSIKFIGIQKRAIVHDLYGKTDCLLFPSKLETWGLPLSEFRSSNKPMIVSDLPYARENVGSYEKVKFFNPEDAEELAAYMLLYMQGILTFDKKEGKVPEAPFFNNWESLLSFLIFKAKEKKTERKLNQ
jgi:glycosyltransferase involved in cell wall biosynthesis